MTAGLPTATYCPVNLTCLPPPSMRWMVMQSAGAGRNDLSQVLAAALGRARRSAAVQLISATQKPASVAPEVYVRPDPEADLVAL